MLKIYLEVGAKNLPRSGLLWDRGTRSQIRRLLYTTSMCSAVVSRAVGAVVGAAAAGAPVY